MAIDFEITARLAKIAEKLETLAGITPTAGLVRDTTITSRLKRIEEAIEGGAFEAHTLGSHTDVTIDSPADGEFLRYDATATDWVNLSAALKDLSDVSSSLNPPATWLGVDYEVPTTVLGWPDGATEWSEQALYINNLQGYQIPSSGSIGRQFVLTPASDPLAPLVEIIWGQVPINLYALLDVDVPSPPPGAEPADDDLLQYDLASSTWKNVTVAAISGSIDHGGLTGLGDDDHAQYLLADGTRPLTAPWTTGDFRIDAGQLTIARTGLTSSFVAAGLALGIADSAGGGIWSGLTIDVDYDYSGAGVSTTVVKGIDMEFDMVVSGGGSVLASPTALDARITIPSATFFVGLPAVNFDIVNNATSLPFDNGAMNTLLTTVATAGTAQRSVIDANSALASSVQAVSAYRGFADGSNLYTGNTVGIHAQTINNTAANGTFGILSTPSIIADSLDNDKKLAFKGVIGSLMLESGNIIATASGVSFYSRPTDVSTTHLNFLNWGQLYIESDAEFDGTVYCDNATLGWRAVADCHLDSNDRLLFGAAQESSIRQDGTDLEIDADFGSTGAILRVLTLVDISTGGTGVALRTDDDIVILADSKNLELGAANDFHLYFDGSNAVLDPDPVTGTAIVLIGVTGDDDMRLTNIEIDGALNHDGATAGFFGTAPVAQAAAYTPTNVSADRSYNADATTINELADVLGTLIADLQAYGLLQ